MARVSNPVQPRPSQSSTASLRPPGRNLIPNYTPEPGEEFCLETERARCEREAAALGLYWRRLVREMRAVDRRLEELEGMLA